MARRMVVMVVVVVIYLRILARQRGAYVLQGLRRV